MGRQLTPEQLEELLRLIAEGVPIPAASGRFGVSKQAVYMRRSRDPDFDIQVMIAEAKAHEHFWGKLIDALENQSKTWQGWACILQRRFGFVDAVDEAKVRSLNATAADEQDRQRKIRMFVESAKYEVEGNPDAKPGDMPAEGEAQPE